MTRSSRRGPWLPEEDHSLMELVRTQGPNNWVRISQQLQHRSPKQCRERYHQNLKPSLNHEPISAQEGELIEQMVHEMGKRWAEIARRLGNRSDNAVKNWWNGSMNRRKRNPSQHSGLKHIGNRLHPVPLTRPERSYVDLPPLPPYMSQLTRGLIHESLDRWPQTAHVETFQPRPGPSQEYKDESFFFAPGARPSTLAQPTPSQFSSRIQPEILHSSSHCAKSELPPLRLPLPNNSQPGWQSPLYRQDERVLVSPAVSETSQAPSTRQEPSLISDNQSTYSISPRTVTSPRLGLRAPVNSTGRSWNICNGSRLSQPVSSRFHSAASSLNADDGYPVAESTCTTSGQRYPFSDFEPTIRRSGSPLESSVHQVLSKNDATRDTRMHLSSLLE